MKLNELLNALNVARATKMEPKEFKLFKVNDDYQLKVYCYCWFVRRFSVREDGECVAASGTEEGLMYELFD